MHIPAGTMSRVWFITRAGRGLGRTFTEAALRHRGRGTVNAGGTGTPREAR